MKNTKAEISDTLLLRPHHGMCFQFYQGKGYSEEFTDHMEKIVAHFVAHPQTLITLRVETDCVCERCPNNHGGVCTSLDQVSAYDSAVLQFCEIKDGATLTYAQFSDLVTKKILDAGLRERICGDCAWNHLCISRI